MNLSPLFKNDGHFGDEFDYFVELCPPRLIDLVYMIVTNCGSLSSLMEEIFFFFSPLFCISSFTLLASLVEVRLDEIVFHVNTR